MSPEPIDTGDEMMHNEDMTTTATATATATTTVTKAELDRLGQVGIDLGRCYPTADDSPLRPLWQAAYDAVTALFDAAAEQVVG